MMRQPLESTIARQQMPGAGEQTRPRRVFRPNVDIVETPSAIELYADMPGVNEGSADITLERDVLTIKGAVHWDVPTSHHMLQREFQVGDYRRQFVLSAEVEHDKIEASMKHGVLHLVLPKAAPAQARKIAVRGG